MRSHQEFIESGILELYVLGQTTAEESTEVESMAKIYPAVGLELAMIEEALEENARLNAVEPSPIVKAFFMATVDFTLRMEQGELPGFPPLLHAESAMGDYAEWLNREDMVAPVDFENIFARLLSYTPEVITAMVWLKGTSPTEVHENEHERFLVVRGTCAISIEDELYYLGPGDFLSIPLYKPHFVTVTSHVPCKVILQRVSI